ncbi:MAG: right-handed parallel beta-helix repeat-containing protein [Anaerolineae bacterium]|jgi:parallel beta-helix repeat protein
MILETGELIDGRYRVVELLAQGGMGAVYRGWDTRLRRPVALKEMKPQPGIEKELLEQLRQQFEHEAQLLATLSHPNLVRVTDYFAWEEKQYLVMDYVEGEDLAERIHRQGAQPQAQVLHWSDQLLDALAYCHKRGILHRDVKPRNIIITPDERAILVDFGLVKLWNPEAPETRTAMRGAGTPEYSPPEQYDGGMGHTDPRSDIYSLGATLYHAVTGQAPPTATRRMANPASFKPPRQINAALNPATEEAILKAMEVSMERRFQTARAMRQALRAASSPAAPSAPVPRGGTMVLPESAAVVRERTRIAPEPQRPAPSKPRRRVGLWIGAALLGIVCLLVVVAGGGALYMAGRPTATPVPITATPTPSPTSLPEPMTLQLPPGGTDQYPDLAAAIAGVPAGSIIVLEGATYRLQEPLVIDKALTLVGASMSQTEIVADGQNFVVRIDDHDGVFSAEGITFRHEGDAVADAVEVLGGEVSFASCRFTGAVRGEEGKGRGGLRLAGATTGSVTDCVASGNDLDGIRLEDQANLTLEGNTCADNVQAGIHFRDSTGGVARDNECVRNGNSGIIVVESARPTLEGNTATDNEYYGIVYRDNASGEARGNDCSRNQLHGIGVNDEAQPTLENNTCSGNVEVGIRLTDAAGGIVRGNTCSENGLHGISVSGTAQPQLDRNICTDNAEVGIRFAEDSGGSATENTCSRNTLHGISVNDRAQPTVQDNTCSENVEVGIRFSEAAGGMVRRNDCSANGLHGISVNDEATPTLEQNTCLNNEQVGIRYSESGAGTARQNECAENGLHGISVHEQARPVLDANICRDNLEGGIVYFDTTGGTARLNECYGNKWGIYIEAEANPELVDNVLYDNTTAEIDDRR